MEIKCTDKEKMLAVLSKLELETNCMWFDGEKPTGCVPDSDTFPIWLLIDEASKITWTGNHYDHSHGKIVLTDDEYLGCKTSNDPVNHPAHYTQGKVECIDAMEQVFGVEAVKHYCLLAAFKYAWRRKDKGNEEQDTRKMLWYFDYYVQLLNR